MIRIETVKRITNATMAIEFLKTLEKVNRWTRKFIVLDCPSDMAKEIVVSHVRDVSLGRRTYHYLLSGLVSNFGFMDICTVSLFIPVHARGPGLYNTNGKVNAMELLVIWNMDAVGN